MPVFFLHNVVVIKKKNKGRFLSPTVYPLPLSAMPSDSIYITSTPIAPIKATTLSVVSGLAPVNATILTTRPTTAAQNFLLLNFCFQLIFILFLPPNFYRTCKASTASLIDAIATKLCTSTTVKSNSSVNSQRFYILLKISHIAHNP